ncbi:glycosyltransferase [Pseudooctadecabacter sp.]|uniref:glycosyltransferase n=1 Tax=Pseudooctadecabacter sp. TaxID=1966338 RepID=UPI003F6B2DA8
MRWAKTPLRHKLLNLKARTAGIRGNVDGEQGDALFGWAQLSAEPTRRLRIGLFARGAMLAETVANIHREDLEAAGIGDGRHAFAIHLGASIKELVIANGGRADIKVVDPKPVKIGTWSPAGATVDRDNPQNGYDGKRDGAKPARNDLENVLYSDIAQLKAALDLPASNVPTRAPLPATHAKLFAQTDYINPDQTLPSKMYGYTEYIRYRDRLDEVFDTANTPVDIEHFYKRYLTLYSAMRGGLRVPLSAEVIAHLNEPVIFGGAVGPFSRIMWTIALETPTFTQNIHLKDEDWYDWAIFWWAHLQVKSLHCEDCLVPDYMIERLKAVPEDAASADFPVSEYMRRLTMEVPAFATFDQSTTAGRRDLTCAFAVRAISRPETLRYLPDGTLDRLFDDDKAFAKFAAKLDNDLSGFTRADFAHAMRHANFDIDAMEGLFFTAEGHRVECAALPAIAASDDPVDVQVIGPFKKASGLGQAVRLSAEMLEAQGISVNKVDFGLDNPAPEGFSRAEAVSNYQDAKINIIHLNGEAIPLAYAYQPDAFTDSYNIGYFFWELDSPGACHYLGMDMLDEIWVSTEFGVSIFQPHVDIPVTNVGMSFEDMPEIQRTDARAFLEKTAKVGPDSFVFMVTFDSFSFVQRKNPVGVLKSFMAAFPSDDPAYASVRLIIKTQNRTKVADTAQLKVWGDIDRLIKKDSRIVLINETLPYKDLLRLKKGSDAYISLHRSEGWGFGLIEAMNLGVPVVTTAYSGNMDFCSPDTCWLVDYDLVELGPHDYIFVREGQHWAEPDLKDTVRALREVFADPTERARRVAAAHDKINREFSTNPIAKRYGNRINEIQSKIAASMTNAQGAS